jgi:hypothetical protein
MDVEEVAALEGWIQAVEPPAAKMVYQEPLEKKVNVQEPLEKKVNVQEPLEKKVNVQELRLDVKAALATKKTTDDDYGYVITDTV